MARAIGFVNNLPRGAVDAVIVDGPNASTLHQLMARGATGGGVTLATRILPLEDLAGSGARVIVVPEGQGAAHAAIAAAARSLRAVTISTDLSCVHAGYCVLGVSTYPRADIIVSRAAADASRVSFSRAFREMIREI